ncbi:hypothetical protein CFC21_108558 [Triticum aestivum]|uniref:DUF4220 domain-containing protein n=3 Tax=Triticinae TaxID=1648030 RepID=A0A9R1G271_WHEAT|nr:hypothetical protein CFC21_049500 [Triticum aestivum]KAF7107997.1 hypothetical protein CFC21_108558 [Triticum aestivum]
MYLLSAKPEILMAGTRRNLFTAAYHKLKEILKCGLQPPVEQRVRGQPMAMGLGRFLYRCMNSKEEKEQQMLEEKSVAERIFTKMETSPAEEGLVHDAWILAKGLLGLEDEKKMWEVIEAVWVEMLCYSASRCRGRLHAKSLGTGGELLTFVWLLWSHMGMETLAERMQMPEVEIPGAGGNAGPAFRQDGSGV